MNRRARRAAKKGAATFVDVHYGRLLERDQNYGLPMVCYVCDAPHKASGLAHIEDKSGTTDVPLCDRCLRAARNDRDTQRTLLRKHLNAPDLEIDEVGELTAEQFRAVAEKQDETEH